MITAYLLSLLVGGGFLALSVFGDFLDGMDVELDADLDGDLGAAGTVGAGDLAKLLSLRTFVYALFGFGATGSLLHLIRGGAQPTSTAVIAGATGLLSGALISAIFRWVRRSAAEASLGERSFVGLAGEVSRGIGPGEMGTVQVMRGERRHLVRARLDSTCPPDLRLGDGAPVVVVGMAEGIASVAPVETNLLEE